MRSVDLLKVVLVLIALAIWTYGVRTSNRTVALVGIGFVVVAFLLRFVPRRFTKTNGDGEKE